MRIAEIGGVDVLAAGALGAIGVDAAIAFVDLDVDLVVDDRIDPGRRETRVAPRVGIEGRDAHQAVHARIPSWPSHGRYGP